jgi:hypothetical protein
VTIAIRPARLEDHAALCALFNELDEFHRQARPDFFRPFDGPARTPGQIEQWLTGPGSTVLVAEETGERDCRPRCPLHAPGIYLRRRPLFLRALRFCTLARPADDGGIIDRWNCPAM